MRLDEDFNENPFGNQQISTEASVITSQNNAEQTQADISKKILASRKKKIIWSLILLIMLVFISIVYFAFRIKNSALSQSGSNSTAGN